MKSTFPSTYFVLAAAACTAPFSDEYFEMVDTHLGRGLSSRSYSALVGQRVKKPEVLPVGINEIALCEHYLRKAASAAFFPM